jgi:chromosomal replication initiation ATPase DnaA
VLREEALRAGLSPCALDGRSRSRVAVAARVAAIRRIEALFPEASSVVLGRMFGRHHTTILHALGRTARARKAQGEAT